MDGQFAQAPYDLQANRHRATLVTHELPGLPAASLPQEPGRLLVQRPGRITAEVLYSAKIFAAEAAGSERCGQVIRLGLVELAGEALKCRRQVSCEIPDGPWRAAGRKVLNGWISCSGEVSPQFLR
jgi:hypothetical protein